jgi:hypothetical protein
MALRAARSARLAAIGSTPFLQSFRISSAFERASERLTSTAEPSPKSRRFPSTWRRTTQERLPPALTRSIRPRPS